MNIENFMKIHAITNRFGLKNWITLLQCFVIVCTGLQAQTGNKYQLSYTETSKTSFAVPDPQTAAKLSVLDKVGFTQTEKVQNVSVVQNSLDDITTTYTVLKDETRKSWMLPVSKIVIDKTGIRSYGPDGKVISQTIAETNYTREYEDLKAEVKADGPTSLYAVKVPDARQVSQLAKDGFTVDTRNNITTIKNAASQTVIDLNNNTVTKTSITSGKISYEQQIRFERGVSGLRPVVRLEKIYETTGSGICYIKLIQTTFSNYTEQLP
jgi:hypothetical protein